MIHDLHYINASRRDIMTSVQKEIVAKVRTFCDEMIAGTIGEEVLRIHKIPKGFLDICRDKNHPSSKKMYNELFMHMMMVVGYYENIADDNELTKINSILEELLRNPKEQHEQQQLHMPRFILGVRNAIDRIEKLNQAQNIDFYEKAMISNVQFGKAERCFQMSYNKDPHISITFEDIQTPATTIQIDGEDFDVPAGGGHLQSHVRPFTQPDEVTIQFDKFHHKCLKEDKLYFYRYITEVAEKDDSCRELEKRLYDIDGVDTYTIDTEVEGYQLIVYNYSHREKRYLVIEYGKSVDSKMMNDLCFTTLVSLGMLTTDIHLNESWLVAYEEADKQNELGLFYQSLVPSIHCNYKIFTTNVYPSLVHIAKEIDPKNGEHRAIDIISKLGLSNALPDFSHEVFGRLVGNMLKYEELRRGIFIVLMGSNLHLEIQAATYCVALEAISNLSKQIVGEEKTTIINDTKAWKKVHKDFNTLICELQKQQIITANERESLKSKIGDMNRQFNSEKLRSLLIYYHFPIRSFDKLTLDLRNLLLHGNIYFKKLQGRTPDDYLFELSMNLHKLCCSIALLMSGYRGYIINNRKLYGFANSYKAFIRIGDNVKDNYPMYKEKKLTLWGKVCRFLKELWMFFLS